MKWVTSECEETLGKWAMSKMKYGYTWGAFRAIGLISETEILATVIYNEFYFTGCAIHIAAVEGSTWANKAFLKAAFEYPFIQLKYERLTGYVPADNHAARRLDEHLGFKQEGILRRFLPDGEDVIVYGMLKDECRFINGRKNATA